MYNAVICRYHEIATKGNNRGFFERTMLENLRRILRTELPDLRYRRIRGRLWMEFSDHRDFTESDLEIIRKHLELRGVGLESFSPATRFLKVINVFLVLYFLSLIVIK